MKVDSCCYWWKHSGHAHCRSMPSTLSALVSEPDVLFRTGPGAGLHQRYSWRAGAAASMAPSPRTGSRQDATALPSMSSTFWAFMILASLLIAYCSEYRAARAPARPSDPGPGPRSRAAAPAGRPSGRPESVRSCELGARGPPKNRRKIKGKSWIST